MTAYADSGTLDANDETIEMNVPFGSHGVATMDITGTITVTWTYRAPGGSNSVPVLQQDGSTAAAYTADAYLYVNAPGLYIGTASGVSGGSCAVETAVGRAY